MLGRQTFWITNITLPCESAHFLPRWRYSTFNLCIPEEPLNHTLTSSLMTPFLARHSRGLQHWLCYSDHKTLILELISLRRMTQTTVLFTLTKYLVTAVRWSLEPDLNSQIVTNRMYVHWCALMCMTFALYWNLIYQTNYQTKLPDLLWI